MERMAISVRQPWAWAILHAGKDVENRSRAGPFRRAVGQRVLIHASRTLRRADVEAAIAYLWERHGIGCPPIYALPRGGVIGEVTVDRIVDRHESPWFAGPVALVLSDPQPLPFVAVKGALGLFAARWASFPADLAVPA